MTFVEAVDVYFTAERRLGFLLVGAAVILLAAGVYLWRGYGGGLGTAMGVPLLVVGLAAGGGGLVLARQVAQRKAGIHAGLASDPQATIAREQARIGKVNASWPWLKRTWAALTVAALAALLLVKRDWVTGLSLAFLTLCTMAMVIDVFAERRALIYAERIAATGVS